MEARRRRIATATQRRQGKGNLGVRLLWTASAGFLAMDDEDDVGERLRQGGAGSGGRWPRECATAAGGGSGGFFPGESEVEEGGNGAGSIHKMRGGSFITNTTRECQGSR